MDESFVQMRDFMIMTDNLIGTESAPLQDAATDMTIAVCPHAIFEDLEDVVFKLRAFTESREGDIGLGVELGMQRAADMIENVINRHRGD